MTILYTFASRLQGDNSEEARARQISNREARAAKRAAQAAKRREEVRFLLAMPEFSVHN